MGVPEKVLVRALFRRSGAYLSTPSAVWHATIVPLAALGLWHAECPSPPFRERSQAPLGPVPWQARYKSTRPLVERKIAHFTRRPWGGRKARVRGTKRVTTDVLTRAAALNWARLATLGLVFGDRGWSLS